MTDSEHETILGSIHDLSAQVREGFKEVYSEISALRVEHAKVATVVDNMKDSSTSLKREVVQIREAQLTCPGRAMAARSSEDSRVFNIPATPEGVSSDVFMMRIPKWMIPLILALLAAVGISIPFTISGGEGKIGEEVKTAPLQVEKQEVSPSKTGDSNG